MFIRLKHLQLPEVISSRILFSQRSWIFTSDLLFSGAHCPQWRIKRRVAFHVPVWSLLFYLKEFSLCDLTNRSWIWKKTSVTAICVIHCHTRPSSALNPSVHVKLSVFVRSSSVSLSAEVSVSRERTQQTVWQSYYFCRVWTRTTNNFFFSSLPFPFSFLKFSISRYSFHLYFISFYLLFKICIPYRMMIPDLSSTCPLLKNNNSSLLPHPYIP